MSVGYTKGTNWSIISSPLAPQGCSISYCLSSFSFASISYSNLYYSLPYDPLALILCAYAGCESYVQTPIYSTQMDDVNCVQGKMVEKVSSAGCLMYRSRLVYADWRLILVLTADYKLLVFTTATGF